MVYHDCRNHLHSLSGKTYAAYSLILQMLHKSVPYRLYFADPKGSSLAVIGSAIAEERTTSDIQDIIGLLEEFVDLMREDLQLVDCNYIIS